MYCLRNQLNQGTPKNKEPISEDCKGQLRAEFLKQVCLYTRLSVCVWSVFDRFCLSMSSVRLFLYVCLFACLGVFCVSYCLFLSLFIDFLCGCLFIL